MNGLKRNSAAKVLRFLEIYSGMPFHRNFPSLLEHRLSESGRFLSATVKAGTGIGRPGGKPADS